MSLIRDVNIAARDSMSIDAFGRWRVSNPATIFDSKQIYDAAPLLWDDQEVSGATTTSVHSVPLAQTTMGVAANTAGKRVRQTFMRFNYQPGKSQFYLMTGHVSALADGIEMNIGPHDDDNGMFFQVKDGILNFVIRSSTSGSAVDTTVAQSAWNVDKMDGTGPSGVTIDATKCFIYWIDQEWLGVGRVRMGFVIDGGFVTCHEFNHANSVDNVYMSTPNNPLRYSIENDGTGAATTMGHICSSVASEGGQEPTGSIRYASTAGAAVTATTENIIYAVMGIRLKAANVSSTVDILQTAIQVQTASETGEWTLRLNPTVAGTFTYANETNSSVMTALGATANTVTGGTLLGGGFGSSAKNDTSSDSFSVDNAIRLGAAINGSAQEMVLCWMPNGGTAAHDVEGSITWRESL